MLIFALVIIGIIMIICMLVIIYRDDKTKVLLRAIDGKCLTCQTRFNGNCDEYCSLYNFKQWK